MIEGRHGFYAIDPGVTTGVARGVVDFGKGARKMKTMLRDAKIETAEFKMMDGDHLGAASEIWDDLIGWEGDLVMKNFEARRMHVVSEDFLLRLPARTSAREGLAPVWVLACLEGLLGRAIERQMPSEAKSFATDERLQLWDLWVRGSEHKRDACRHLALKVGKLCSV
jgi:hypothetical protein